MATIDLGRIKFKWQGAYNGATAYVVDDVVSYQGSSYVCILASTGNLPTNTTYWSIMAQAGTDITSLAGLAQGDILYYDGSNWVRLGAGTSGQVLQTNGAAANPSWVDASSGKIGQILQTVKQDTASTTSQTFSAITGLSQAITPTATSSKVLVQITVQSSSATGTNAGGAFRLYRDGSEVSAAHGATAGSRITGFAQAASGANQQWKVHTSSFQFLDSPNTTSSTTYQIYWRCQDTATGSWLNRGYDDGDSADRVRFASQITLTEVLA